MHRIILPLVWACSVLASEDSILRFTKEPSSVIANLGQRVVLHCNTNLPVVNVIWHFDDATLRPASDSSESKQQRRKRNGEESIHSSFDRHFDSHTATSRHLTNDLRHLPFSVRKKISRRKSNRKQRLVDEELGNRYVRSEERAKSVSAKTYGIHIRNGRLVIQNLSNENKETYYCVAANAHGSIRSIAANIQVAYIANFTQDPPRSVLAKSSAVILPCLLPESIPRAIPIWRRNGKILEARADGPYLVMRSGDLLIKNVTSSAGSKFHCGAMNSIAGETKFASAATVLSLSPGTGDEMRSDRIYPTSDKGINVTVETDKELLMECVSGDLSTFVWTRDNGPIPDDADITEVGLKLVATVSDSGQYTCKSATSESSVVFNLRVLESPRVESVMPDRVTLENENDVIALRCALHATANSSWEWYYNGEAIRDVTGPEFNVSTRIGYSDGFYQCFARNILGVDHATFLVKEADDQSSNPALTTSEDYFSAAEDRDAVGMPMISRAPSAKHPTSHKLTWTMSGTEAKLFSVKYYKEPYVDSNGKAVNYDNTVINVPGDRREVVLDGLDSGSTFVVEMVAVSDAGTRSDFAISSFGTSSDTSSNNRPGHVPANKPNKDGGKRGNSENGRNTRVPRAPSRPAVSASSIHEVSLMWTARGNGGSPIIAYRIQRKEIEGKGGWEKVGVTKTFPYRVLDLQKGKSYKFRVIAFNAAGDSKPSSASKPYPKRMRPQLLIDAPKIVKATAQELTSIIIMWTYENVPLSSIRGYYIYHRPTDSDDEEDYAKETLTSSSADRYVIHNLEPEMQYDVKIRAFNELGGSKFSNVMILEMPNSGGAINIPVSPKTNPPVVDVDTDSRRNDPAWVKARQRDAIFLITGAVIGAILIVLLITVFCYWRRRGAQKAQSTPETKQKNGNACGYTQGKPSNHINMAKLKSNGHLTPSGSDSPHQHFHHSPHGTRCHCSRHHSGHSSLGRDASHPPCSVPPGPRYPAWGPSNYPNIHSNPMHMYMDPRPPYFSPHGIGGWVRNNNGEFCHIIPVDTRKLNGEGGAEVIGHYLHPGGHMVTRTYDGNLTTPDNDSTHRPDHGYHSNEEWARTGSDSQAEKSDDAIQVDDAKSAECATSDGVTVNDVATESRPSSPSTRDDDVQPNELALEATYCAASSLISQDQREKVDEEVKNLNISVVGEKTPFFNENISELNETLVS